MNSYMTNTNRLMIKAVSSVILISMVLAGILFAANVITSDPSEVHGASQASLMKKTLKAYKARNYKLARKYNKKMPKYAKEKCVKRMSSKQKAKYYRIVMGWEVNRILGDYYLTDYNNDGVADLILRDGIGEAGAVFRIYTYKKGKIKKLGKISASHAWLCAYPGRKGLIKVGGQMGVEWIEYVYRKGNKNRRKSLVYRNVKKYFYPRNMLKSHVHWTDDGEEYFDYDDLF